MTRSKRTIIVGGGRGFIGGHLCVALLRCGANVISVDSGLFEPSSIFLENCTCPNLLDLTADACEYEYLLSQIGSKQPVEAVINCVGPARPSYYMENPVRTVLTLAGSTHSLLELAAHMQALYIHASSSEVYGNVGQGAVTESAVASAGIFGVSSPYGQAKRFSEILTSRYAEKKQVRAVILRLFNVYGPGFSSDDDRVVAAFVRSLLANEPLRIHGDGEQIRCFCFIDDVVRAFEYAMSYNDSAFCCVNVGNPEPIAVLRLAELIRDLSARVVAFEPAKARPDDVRRRVPDITQAQGKLGWEPHVMLKDGLLKTLSYYSLAPTTVRTQAAKEKREAADS